MDLIKAGFEFIEQGPGLEGAFKQIEIAGRTCYKSEDKITPDSAQAFVERMVNSGHGAMLEHGTVYLYIKYGSPLDNDNEYFKLVDIAIKYKKNKYSVVNTKVENTYWHHCWITTNYRVLVENGWLDDLQYQCEPTEHHEKRITVKFILPISISREFIRHRTASFAEQSTRYCNYSKSKFGEELTFITPYWYDDVDSYTKNEFDRGLQYAEGYYMFMIDKGMKPQEAREILPLCTKTELVMTAFISDWKHFFKLRCHSTAHPQAREIAIPLQEQFIKKGYING